MRLPSQDALAGARVPQQGGEPMRSLVTGVAGFIGSHLAETLLERGHEVIGADSFRDYYSKKTKLSNISRLRKEANFEFFRIDLASSDLSQIVAGTDYVFHLAAQPGVRGSWGTAFSIYVRDNVLATQRLLEAVKRKGAKKLVYASSSSIYGDAERLPTREDAVPRPISPYGVTKLAAEHLCLAYLRNHGVPSVILRYFTVYGPRQRPDMAFSTFISKILSGREVSMYGDGRQRRDFTYVHDTVSATISALNAAPGSVYNVGNGRPYSLNGVVALLERLLDRKARIRRSPPQAGDVKSTCADITRITRDLKFLPSTSLTIGLRRQIEDYRAVQQRR